MKRIVRESKETQIEIRIGLARGKALSGGVSVSTTLPFYDHMLSTLARYAGLELTLRAKGDLRHHIMEDVALALGHAVRSVAPKSATRYGEKTIPMDDALVQAVIDVGGRAFFVGKLPSRLYTHVLRSFSDALQATLHVRVLRGKDKHHIIEAGFKATGLALRQALSETEGGIFSTKGQVLLTEEDIADVAGGDS
ncbi:imidazoleglycerol-phosphate dehydratase [Pendulispora rubella]|uniref:Imidazoleglycerol-phosphate dehydratase n=1 Tax=Pendulispora rubella TaxID=2741070 RepID=A0ABZ2KUK9_9BACT